MVGSDSGECHGKNYPTPIEEGTSEAGKGMLAKAGPEMVLPLFCGTKILIR
jgi:hypothetical protein